MTIHRESKTPRTDYKPIDTSSSNNAAKDLEGWSSRYCDKGWISADARDFCHHLAALYRSDRCFEGPDKLTHAITVLALQKALIEGADLGSSAKAKNVADALRQVNSPNSRGSYVDILRDGARGGSAWCGEVLNQLGEYNEYVGAGAFRSGLNFSAGLPATSESGGTTVRGGGSSTAVTPRDDTISLDWQSASDSHQGPAAPKTDAAAPSAKPDDLMWDGPDSDPFDPSLNETSDTDGIISQDKLDQLKKMGISIDTTYNSVMAVWKTNGRGGWRHPIESGEVRIFLGYEENEDKKEALVDKLLTMIRECTESMKSAARHPLSSELARKISAPGSGMRIMSASRIKVNNEIVVIDAAASAFLMTDSIVANSILVISGGYESRLENVNCKGSAVFVLDGNRSKFDRVSADKNCVLIGDIADGSKHENPGKVTAYISDPGSRGGSKWVPHSDKNRIDAQFDENRIIDLLKKVGALEFPAKSGTAGILMLCDDLTHGIHVGFSLWSGLIAQPVQVLKTAHGVHEISETGTSQRFHPMVEVVAELFGSDRQRYKLQNSSDSVIPPIEFRWADGSDAMELRV